MSERILFVDDDQKILNGISRQFEDDLDLETCNNPVEALELVRKQGPFAVVVSDMRMPEMTGVELLMQVRELAPETVRIMLTGYADVQVTMDAVNEGNIFRFLSKPCKNEVLENAVRDGLEQYRLIRAEHELLEGTLQGCVKVLSEMLSLVNPLAFGRTSQVQRIAVSITEQMNVECIWDVKIASMLFPLGCITVSEKALECALQGRPLPADDRSSYERHADLARQMLEKIPRLENVASIVAYQDKGFDGTGIPRDDVRGDKIPIGARILKVASDFELAYKKTMDAQSAFKRLREYSRLYDPTVMAALEQALRHGLCRASQHPAPLESLETGMVLAEDVRGVKGQLMMSAGQEITESILQRLANLVRNGVVEEPFMIEVLGEVAEPAATTAS